MSAKPSFPLDPPIEPMLAKLANGLPPAGNFLYEPKWDGFRAIVFRSHSDLLIQSRELKPLDRYFPELREVLLKQVPPGSVLDGEVIIATPDGLDFDALQQRIHPAESRIRKLAAETPSSFVAFDLLAMEGKSVMDEPQEKRRAGLEKLLRKAKDPLHLTPVTTDRATAARWLQQFEGAGLDGVMAKPVDAVYQPGKRAMIKVKHERTAECAVAGFRWHKAGKGIVGSLLLGLYDRKGTLHHVGVTSSFTMARRKELAAELEPLRKNALEAHPWREWAEAQSQLQRLPGAQSRWSAGKDLSWEPLRVERVCEVKYDHLQGDRFRHGTTFLRWRFDKSPKECRYDQLETVKSYQLAEIFSGRSEG
jgi:ATP-dependent DNA ligase